MSGLFHVFHSDDYAILQLRYEGNTGMAAGTSEEIARL
jgi:hypothetical protein